MNSQSSSPSSFRFCDQCGSKIFHEQNTCSRCGAARPMQIIPIPVYARLEPKPKMTPAWVMIVICGLCGMCGLFGLINSPNKNLQTVQKEELKITQPNASETPNTRRAESTASPFRQPLARESSARNSSSEIVKATPTPAIVIMGNSTRGKLAKNTKPKRNTRRSNLIRGPRGGCYYINSHGNKTYVDRNLCN
jgi:Na+-translocating ferredoxin:NAD+ oxidoreductase RnfC subunit